IRQRGLMPLDFIGQIDSSYSGKRSIIFGKDFDVYDFTNRLVPLLEAHIHLERALGILAESVGTESSRHIVSELRRGLHEGKKFSTLIRSHGKRFPNIFSVLVEAGEESGSLPEVMKELHNFLNARKEMRDFLVTTSIYPAIVLSVTLSVIVLLFTVFVPRFSKIFTEMGKPLPLPTKIMLELGDAASSYWWLALILGIVLFSTYLKLKNKEWMLAGTDRNLLKIPVLGKLLQMIEISRYIRTLAILLKNHVHLLNSVNIAVKVLSNTQIVSSISNLPADLRGGMKLSQALSKSSYIPKDITQMLAIGEESGNIGSMLDKIADQCESELKIKVRRLLALFEPAVILFLAVVVLAVVISIFMAIMEMNRI
ncbi:MAG: type II secretion system F family protein, partial [Candidatus Moranbacteria bacterium]|nr:type II secretion system F family protein [Candidatus Moranbacteria bacterium]